MILALDTSLADLSIGLFTTEGKALASFHHAPAAIERGVHDSLLAQKTSELLKEVGGQAKDIERIVYISGPGSFTGLRIGLSFVKGIAFASEAAIVPVPSHVALHAALDRKHQHESELLFAYPGYDRHSLYIAHAGAINDVALVPLHDLLPNLAIAGPPAALDLLAGKHERMIPCSINLALAVQRSMTLPAVKGFEALAAHEPLYLTAFTPHPASKRPNG